MKAEQKSEDIPSLYLRAVELHRQGCPGKAAVLYATVADHFPEAAEVHYNLGLALYETEKYASAAKSFRRAAELQPEDADILYNLGLACKRNKKYEVAEEAYLKALQLEPDNPDTLYNLACCYQDGGYLEQACLVYERVLEIAPEHVSAINNLAFLNHLQKDLDRARELYGRLLELEPDRRAARHMYAALSGRDSQAPPREYVRELFDQYSERFEENLTKDLKYTTYKTMRRVFDELAAPPKQFSHALDLGCGTGLAGVSFHAVCRLLDGIDLSEKMLEQAAAKEIYSHLFCGDIVEFLEQDGPTYDLLLAADVLPYLGDLAPLFAAAASRTQPGGLFCLSAEKATAADWELRPSGRYGHNPDYIGRTATDNSWRILNRSREKLRREHGSWIIGTIFILEREDG